RSDAGQGRPVNVEFVSANPTGPLHVGHGRQAALGDAIASLLDWTGWRVTREFYYNDGGAQIMQLARSVQARIGELRGRPTTLPEGGYHGEYIRDIAARWLKTTDVRDDKDRVMSKRVEKGGEYTYFLPDVAYHVDKWERGFARAINVQGADHHSTVTRVRIGLQALELGIPAGYPEYVLHQMVTVMKGGAEVKLSKRAGSYLTVRELVDEVGRDAVRYFFLMRRGDSHLVFDVDLAK